MDTMARFVVKNGSVHKHEDHLRFHSEHNWEGLYKKLKKYKHMCMCVWLL